MKALVLIGSRADRNGSEVVWEALNKSGHQAALVPYHCMGEGTAVMRDGEVYSAENVSYKLQPDVVIASGDRLEMLKMATAFAGLGLPIAHIAGGDVTEGSADDRYRDAITALSCIHFATNAIAFNRLTGGDYDSGPLIHKGDKVYMTGSPAIDRIKQTPLMSWAETLHAVGKLRHPMALVCVHPNTVGDKQFADYEAVRLALQVLKPELGGVVWIGANADPGGAIINKCARGMCEVEGWYFAEHVEPRLYYSLMKHCDVMVGNSSAMLYEAPCFGLPCVLVGDRQKGRPYPPNIILAPLNEQIVPDINIAIKRGRLNGCSNPYGDGNSAPRIVKALEENAWRWSKAEPEVKRGLMSDRKWIPRGLGNEWLS